MNKRAKIIRTQLVDEAGKLLPKCAMNLEDYRLPLRRSDRLPVEQQARADALYERAAKFFPGMTKDKWNDTLLRDHAPAILLAAWESVADVFESDIGRQELWDNSRRVQVIADIRSDVVDVGGHHGISDQLVAEIRVALGSITSIGSRVSKRPSTLPEDVMVHIEDLSTAIGAGWRDRDEPLLEMMADADVVIGIHLKTHETTIFYGRDVLDAAIREDPEWAGRSPKVLTVGMDLSERVQDFELLAAICTTIKGSCEVN